MGSLSISHILLILVVVLVVFGAGKIPRLMGDVAKGVKAFRDGMKEEGNEKQAGDTKKLNDKEF